MSSYSDTDDFDEIVIPPREPLTTKRAVELLLGGKLKDNVCKYCLTVSSSLTDLDQFLKVTGEDGFYKVTVKDMVANFYPYQVHADQNLPDQVCEVCLNRILSCYLFVQQCERSERAIRNCFEQVIEKLDKLDPINRIHNKGRRKANPNTNKLFVSYKRVLDYADPLISLVNQGATMENPDPQKADFECPRCWQSFNNIEELLNHEKSHPKTMWFYCRLCGLSFAKENYYRKHLNTAHEYQNKALNPHNNFKCRECGVISNNYQSQLQHNEKHKFKNVMVAILDKQMDKLCTICLEKGNKMVDLDSTIRVHGGYPGVSGDHSLYNVVGSSLPNQKSRHKFQELLVSSAAKVLRMKRKSDMIDDTLTSTMSGTIVDNYNQSISHQTISSQNTSLLNEEKNTNNNFTNNHSKDTHSEFVFSMPLIIPAKRPKLDLETPKRTISRESLQTKRQFYNRPNFFMFKYALNKKLDQSYLNTFEDHLPYNKEPYLKEIEKEIETRETFAPIEKKVSLIPLKDNNKNILPLQSNNKNLCKVIESNIDKNIVPLQPSNKNVCVVKESNTDTDIVPLQPSNKIVYTVKESNTDKIDVNLTSNENITKEITKVNNNNKKASNQKIVQEATDNIADYSFIFAKALNLRKNLTPCILNLIEQELLKFPTGISLNNFAFSKPIECGHNIGKNQIWDKSSQATNLNKAEGIELTGSINKFNTSSEMPGNNNEIEVSGKISEINCKCHCGRSDETQEVCTLCNVTSGNTLPDIVNVEKIIDIQHNTDNDKNKLLGQNIFPAILTDTIKVLNFNLEKVDKNNDTRKSYDTILTRDTNKDKEKTAFVKRDILKENQDKDNVTAPKTENITETISRKRKTTDETFVLETTDWECTYCFTNNYSYRISCFCCESVRDVYKSNINIDFGSSKKRRLYEKNKEQAEDKKNEENNTKDSREEQEKPRLIFPLPNLQEQATPIKIITTEMSTTKVITTEPVSTITTTSETAKKEENILPKPILPFTSSVGSILQFAKSDAVEKKKEESTVDTVDTPKLILNPTNVETTGTNNEKNIKKTVKFEDTIKTFKIPFKADTAEKPLFQFGKTTAPETKKGVTTPQVPAEQKFDAIPNLGEAKPPITQVLDDIDMAEITDHSAGFSTPSSSVAPQASILPTLFPTPTALSKTFEQKDTTNTFKGFGNFGTPLTTFTENKTFETPAAAATPFTFNNNLNFSIGAGNMENKGNANANRKAETRRIRTARRRCT